MVFVVAETSKKDETGDKTYETGDKTVADIISSNADSGPG